MKPFLQVHNLIHTFPLKKKEPFSLGKISFSIQEGESLAIVGESGSGKTTLGNLILGFIEPNSGNILFEGKDLRDLSFSERAALRKKIQVVFQNPSSSLSPKKTVEELLKEPFLIHKKPVLSQDIDALLEKVFLPSSCKKRYPHEFSGGQKQRIAIARALALNPKCIICDEALSALDVSIQTQILSLLLKLKKEENLSYVYITHQLTEAYHLADTVLVLKGGKQIELSDKETLFSDPKDPYTQKLLEASRFLKSF